MPALQPRPGILDIAPYIGGRSQADGQMPSIRLASNEGALGPSPEAVEAYRSVAGDLHRYPDGASSDLRHAISARFRLNPDNIVCGAGSDELIALLLRSYAGPDSEVLYSAHGFLMYPISAMSVGARPVAAPETNLRADVDALLSRVTDRTRVVFLANPNNPTGSYLSADELRRLRAGLREDILLVVDAAYAEYVSRPDYSPGLELVDETENTVMTRTFSKLFALASLRLGWCYGPRDVVDVLNRVRGPFNVSLAAQKAGVAALADRRFYDRSRAHNDVWLPWAAAQLRRLGLEVPDCVGNFLIMRFPAGASAASGRGAEDAEAFLRSRGILTRKMRAYGLPDCLRFSIGTESEMKAVIAALTAFLEQDPS